MFREHAEKFFRFAEPMHKTISVSGLLKRSFFLLIFFLLCHLTGLRVFTSVLCGTFQGSGITRFLSAFLGILYIAMYIAATIICPILVIASGMLWLIIKILPSRRNHSSGA